jgi:indole-3-acetate monooxygenase
MLSTDTPTRARPRVPRPGRAWPDRLRAVAPAIAEWRDAAEREHQLPRPLVAALQGAGVFGLAADARAGGAAVRDARLLRVIEGLARRDGSVGWNVAIAAHAAVMASYLPPAALDAAYRQGPDTVFAGGLLPKGAAAAVPGGFRLTGRWSFASGCRQAAWLFAPGAVVVGGQPRLGPAGRPELRAFCVPAAACEVLDTWDTAGLRGTGSHDFRLADVFVPEAWSFPIQPDGPSQPGVLTLGHFLPYAQPSIAAVALGIARAALDAFTELAAARTPTLGSGPLAGQHTVQERVGRAEALVGSARAFLYETARALPASPDWSRPPGEPLTARIRLASAHAARSAAEAVDLLFTAAGTASIFTHSRLERCFRDVHVATQHAAVAAWNIEMVGQFLLGLGLQLRR